VRFFLTIFFLFYSVNANEITKALQFIPQKDKEKIELLFTYFVQCDNLGHVLFGKTKTAAVATIPLVCDFPLVPPFVSTTPLCYQKQIKESWQVWQQYSYKFRHPNIIICLEHVRLKQYAFLNIFFIHKERLQKLLQEHHQAFAEILGDHFSAKAFIAKLERKKKLRPLLRHDEKLLGLILGFGSEASTTFKQMRLGEQVAASFKVAGYKPAGSQITPVSFRGDPNSSEVRALVDSYTKEMATIERILKSDTFLITTLQQLVYQNPTISN